MTLWNLSPLVEKAQNSLNIFCFLSRGGVVVESGQQVQVWRTSYRIKRKFSAPPQEQDGVTRWSGANVDMDALERGEQPFSAKKTATASTTNEEPMKILGKISYRGSVVVEGVHKKPVVQALCPDTDGFIVAVFNNERTGKRNNEEQKYR